MEILPAAQMLYTIRKYTKEPRCSLLDLGPVYMVVGDTRQVTSHVAGHPTYHVDVIKLKCEIIWTGGLSLLGGLPHLPGVPYLHVNRPLDINGRKLNQVQAFFSTKGGIYRAVTKGLYRGFIRLPATWLFGYFHKKEMKNQTKRISQQFHCPPATCEIQATALTDTKRWINGKVLATKYCFMTRR